MRTLFRKKLIKSDDNTLNLKKCLTVFDLTLLGIGGIIGTGIFVLTGVAAATQAGPAIILSFIIAGFACACAAFSYAELASSVGGSGSAYGYSYAAFGEIIAWLIGWDLILEYGMGVATVANGWSGYFNNILTAVGVSLPGSLIKGPFEGGVINLPAVSIIMTLMILLIAGAKESTRLNNVMVIVKLSSIFIFVLIASFYVNPENWIPFMPFGWFEYAEGGKTVGVLAAASLVFFSYIGFDAVSTAAEEAINPKKTVPIAILTSLFFCTIIYIIVSNLLTGIVHYSELNVASPVSYALQLIGIRYASALVATGVITGLTTVMLVLYYALTRVIFAIARDGLMPGIFSRLNKKTNTPTYTTILCGFVMALTAGFVPLGILAEMVNIGTLAAFVLVCVGVVVLRITNPNLPRPFKCPLGFFFPIAGAISCGALIIFLPYITHLRFLLWLLAGVIVYFSYSRKHSILSKK